MLQILTKMLQILTKHLHVLRERLADSGGARRVSANLAPQHSVQCATGLTQRDAFYRTYLEGSESAARG